MTTYSDLSLGRRKALSGLKELQVRSAFGAAWTLQTSPSLDPPAVASAGLCFVAMSCNSAQSHTRHVVGVPVNFHSIFSEMHTQIPRSYL